MMTEKREKIYSLDVLRVYACFILMAFHAFIPVAGLTGLSIFLVMSGFLSAYNHYGDGKTAQLGLRESLSFSLNKIKKLYPLHLVMLIYPVFVELYKYFNGMQTLVRYFVKLAANILLVQAWIPIYDCYYSFNVPSWYLSAMIFIYFMLPLILRCMEKYRSRRTAVVAIIAIYLAQVLSARAALYLYTAASPGFETPGFFHLWFYQVFPVYRLGDFAIGCNLAYIFMHRAEQKPSRAAGTVLELAAVGLLALLSVRSLINVPQNVTVFYMPASAALVYVFALNSGYVSAFFTNKVIRHLASLSSYVYLIHAPVIALSSAAATWLPLSVGVQKVFFMIFAFGGTYVLALAWRELVIKRRRLPEPK